MPRVINEPLFSTRKDIRALDSLPLKHAQTIATVRTVDLALDEIFLLYPGRAGREEIRHAGVCRMPILLVSHSFSHIRAFSFQTKARALLECE